MTNASIQTTEALTGEKPLLLQGSLEAVESNEIDGPTAIRDCERLDGDGAGLHRRKRNDQRLYEQP
jgi:hypothetical protein